jgi:cbb3-type cytochrome oxidase subunit 3
MNEYVRHTLKFIGLFALQILIISQMQLSYYINPYVHLLFLLTLPNSISLVVLLLLAFASGLLLDMFLDTMGLHAAASVLMAFCRPYLLNVLTPKGNYEATQNPNINSHGITWFAVYLSIHTLIYESFYFMLEVFSFHNFSQTLIKIILSVVFSVVLMMLLAFLFSPNKRKRLI